jgi:hypothetical protein
MKKIKLDLNKLLVKDTTQTLSPAELSPVVGAGGCGPNSTTTSTCCGGRTRLVAS